MDGQPELSVVSRPLPGDNWDATVESTVRRHVNALSMRKYGVDACRGGVPVVRA